MHKNYMCKRIDEHKFYAKYALMHKKFYVQKLVSKNSLQNMFSCTKILCTRIGEHKFFAKYAFYAQKFYVQELESINSLQNMY